MTWSNRWRSVKPNKNMTTLPDYSEYLKKPNMLDWIEQEWKDNPAMHDEHSMIVNNVIEKYNCRVCIEFGCGTGELAKRIVHEESYIGFDINSDCIKYATNKNDVKWKRFFVDDIRKVTTKLYGVHDLVISFGFLKHFGLHEWSTIFNKVALFGEYFIFDMPIAKETHDDGTEFHHVWKNLEELEQDIDKAGFEVLEIINTNPVEPVFVCKRSEL